MIVQLWDIPGAYDLGAHLQAQKQTLAEVIVKVRGGALPDGQAVMLHFMEVDLRELGQLHMQLETDDPEIHSSRMTERPQLEMPFYLSINLNRARIVPQDGQLFEQRVVTF